MWLNWITLAQIINTRSQLVFKNKKNCNLNQTHCRHNCMAFMVNLN